MYSTYKSVLSNSLGTKKLPINEPTLYIVTVVLNATACFERASVRLR